MDKLPEARAALIRATKIDGLSNAEAGAALGVSEGAVKVNVHRGMKALKNGSGSLRDAVDDGEAAE